jgi:hypothetical protein
MNSVPAEQRGGAAGIQAAFMNTGMVLSIGVFFSLMIVGLTHTLPKVMYRGLSSHGVAAAQAHSVASLPAVGTLFSSFLGFNPLKSLLVSQTAIHVTHAQWVTLTGKRFFPDLLQSPFHHGLDIVFSVAIVMALLGALASALRGERFVAQQPSLVKHEEELATSSGAVAGEVAIEGEVVR